MALNKHGMACPCKGVTIIYGRGGVGANISGSLNDLNLLTNSGKLLDQVTPGHLNNRWQVPHASELVGT